MVEEEGGGGVFGGEEDVGGGVGFGGEGRLVGGGDGDAMISFFLLDVFIIGYQSQL